MTQLSSVPSASSPSITSLPVAVDPSVAVPAPSTERAFRDLDAAYGNQVFRFLIWRDMFWEFMKDHPWFGFSFGKPQRSLSLEVLRMGEVDWMRDGWIAPHNSFLHILYRGGIMGLALILAIIWLIVGLTKDFLHARSWRGGLLISGLISWIIMAQFGVILELPYNAIPFWSMFGFALAYREKLQAAQGQGKG